MVNPQKYLENSLAIESVIVSNIIQVIQDLYVLLLYPRGEEKDN